MLFIENLKDLWYICRRLVYILYLFGIEYILYRRNNNNLINSRATILTKKINKAGPLFIKLAQWLTSMYSLNDHYQKHLSSFQSNCEINLSLEQIMAPIDFSVKSEIKDIKLVSAGTVGIVLSCQYQGKCCILKILRPNIKDSIDLDIKILKWLYSSVFRLNIVKNLDDILLPITRQCDFTYEVHNMKKFKNNMHYLPDIIVIPEVYKFSEQFILEEFIEGDNLNDVSESRKHVIKINLATIYLKMIFCDRLFHCDMHLGNFVCTPDNKIGLLDFGICDVFLEKDIDFLTKVFTYFIGNEVDQLIELSEMYYDTKYTEYDIQKIKIIYNQYKHSGSYMMDFLGSSEKILRLYRETKLRLPNCIVYAISTIFILVNNYNIDYINLVVHKIISDWKLTKVFNYKLLPIINVTLYIENNRK